jgi:DNA-binding winged helix-turn-helix (wHTH) protein/TolB-like protein
MPYPLKSRRIIVLSERTMEGNFRLGEWLVSPMLNTVQADGPPTRIEHKCMQVLVCLAHRPGDVVSKDQLMRAVWPDTFVTDDVLTRAISELRRVLRDEAKRPHLIETISKTGYRLIAPVTRDSTAGAPSIVPPSAEPSRHWRNTIVLVGLAVLVIAAAISALSVRNPSAPQSRVAPRPIAVLPLQNINVPKDLDFLRTGLADEIATTLAYFPALSIRPSAATNKFAASDLDLQEVAKELHVADLVTGHFATSGDQIEISLEAVDAATNSVLWRDTIRGPTHDLSAIRQQIANRVEHGLLSALNVSPNRSAPANVSRNPDAYELYLRALSQRNLPNLQTPYLFENNDEAIRLLQRAVALDPGYASAWAALGHLYYYESSTNQSNRRMAKAALQRAVSLDSNRFDAASDLINIESEEGQLNQAYDDSMSLLRRRPDSGDAHLVYSYVLWYAGLTKEAAAECEKTRSIDAATTDLATCSNIYMALGQYSRARDYLQLESGTGYQKGIEVDIFLREGKGAEALKSLQSLPQDDSLGRELLEPCLQNHPSTINGATAQKVRAKIMAVDDPYMKYGLAAWDSLCGRKDAAYAALAVAISQNYCAYPQMDSDPLFASIRDTPQFAVLRTRALACQKNFTQHRQQYPSP